MKKALMAVLLAFALLLGGCGANAVPAQEAAPAPEETPVPVSEPAEPSPTPEEIVPTPEPDPLEEARELISQLLLLDNPYNCPHGRPTILSMSKTEIEKKFHRIV